MHIPVLLHEAIDTLSVEPGNVVVDGTYGGGGHTNELLKQFGETVRIICVDLDEQAEERFKAAQYPSTVQFVHQNFKNASEILAAAGVEHADRVLLDLGTSTFQLLEDTRGFSFRSDTPLRMTFSAAGAHTNTSAYDVVNGWGEETLETIFKGFGEERRARTIARAIVTAREKTPITSSGQLAALVEAAIGRRGKTHPATRVFQAIRIAVNEELGVLEAAITNWFSALPAGGRLAIITFHSLEDRIVKRAFASYHQKQFGRVITKKPLVPKRAELISNPRSRSAKLRSIEKL
ncbi:MAG TPA: 16S rRNA (cytosine(1402)-N(4))-methyltransferase RsmH [Candidatus Paceibacterota bacterium]|nr:16S rRNA (cytosine(1402)-N(4))-methyltransferase RsmH [Candidatus Paceibacterota bacterium]